MKVKVGDKIYDGKELPVMIILKDRVKKNIAKVKVEDKIYDIDEKSVRVILTDGDRKNIANMHPECTRYCEYPEDKYSSEEIKVWMLNPSKEELGIGEGE